jgi:hypothetical protein
VVQIEFQYIPTFTVIDALLDLRPYGAAALKDRFVDWTWAQVSGQNGEVWAIPQDTGPMGMLYRQDIFDSYGIAVPRTWDEFAAAARTLHAANPDVYLTNFAANQAAAWHGLMWQAGAKPYVSNSPRPVRRRVLPRVPPRRPSRDRPGPDGRGELHRHPGRRVGLVHLGTGERPVRPTPTRAATWSSAHEPPTPTTRLEHATSPTRLTDAAAVRYDEFSNLTHDIPLVPGGPLDLRDATATHWADGLTAIDADVLAEYDHPHFGRWPAITTRVHGEGRITYVGTVPGRALAQALARWLAPSPVSGWHDLPAAVTATTGTAPDGRRVHVVHNWSWDPARVQPPRGTVRRHQRRTRTRRTGPRPVGRARACQLRGAQSFSADSTRVCLRCTDSTVPLAPGTA